MRGDVGERVDEQRAAAGDEAAVASTDRLGEPHERLTVRVLFAPAAVVPRADRTRGVRAAPSPRCSGPAQPTRATRISSTAWNISLAWRDQHVGETGREPAPSAIVTPALFAFGWSARIASIASCSSSLETNGTPAVIAAVATAWSTPVGSAHATTSMPSGIGSPGRERVHRGLRHRARRRPWPCGRRRCRPAAPRRRPGCRPVGGRHACRRRRHRRRATLTGTRAPRARASLRSSGARRPCPASARSARRAGQAEDEEHAAEGLHSAGVYRAASAFGFRPERRATPYCYDRRLPGAIAQSVRAHR